MDEKKAGTKVAEILSKYKEDWDGLKSFCKYSKLQEFAKGTKNEEQKQGEYQIDFENQFKGWSDVWEALIEWMFIKLSWLASVEE